MGVDAPRGAREVQARMPETGTSAKRFISAGRRDLDACPAGRCDVTCR
jgi:hypothetical protein